MWGLELWLQLGLESGLLCPRPRGGGALSDTHRDPSACLSVSLSCGAAAYAIGTLAAFSLATAGHQRCADYESVRGRT